ncbi:MAG TPA: lysophospholipid acyltransferase family protein [Gemmatimonadaceae bacterium]|jgi:1-acyl-sn-glycerol-3-phosphate acyltransferase|nr:lysophospholipid acyltransferase family protein [Gemmatimonadaceae bacterium]
MIAFLRTILLFVTAFFATFVIGSSVIIAAMFGVKDKPGGIFEKAPRWWSAAVLWAAGIKIRVHGRENLAGDAPRIFASNHVSWFDVPALARILPRYKFVAKAELFKVPIFGKGMRAAGMIELQRENRKAAFGAYEVAAERIRAGNSVVVFPEGTRGHEYPLRPFKKGPFVLAIAAGVPIVPIVVHGTIEIMPKGSLWAHPGTIDVHLLEPVSTTGIDYDHREALMQAVRTRMADTMRKLYGIEPLPTLTSRLPSSAEILSTETQPTETR